MIVATVINGNEKMSFFVFFREELDFAYQIDGTTDEAEEAIGYQSLSALAQQHYYVLALYNEKA